MNRAGSAWVAMVVAFAGLPGGASAQSDDDGTRIHKAQPGDSLELLAAEYYGDRRHKIYIMIENGFDHARELKKGERLRIPVSADVTVGVGDSLETLAAQYLGDARRSVFLADFNGLAADGALAAGLTLSVPLRVTYRAAGVERLEAIAQALFADGKKAALLKAYNFLDNDELKKGDSIIIPIYMRVQPSKRRPPDADSQALASKRNQVLDLARKALPKSRTAWKGGDYSMVKRELAELVKAFPYLDPELVVEIGVLLGSAYVAFEDLETAHATFEQVLDRSPNFALEAYAHSPKVRDAWRKAGGVIAEPAPP